MSRKVKSARGVMVDFDLPLIKNQILKTPKTDDIKKRERFIDKRRRKTSRNTVDQLLASQLENKTMVDEALKRQVAAALIIPDKPMDKLPENPHTEVVDAVPVVKPIVKKV